MWIAKNKDTGKEYPKKFKSIYDCQDYINTELNEDLRKANDEYVKRFRNHNFGFPPMFYCNRILCWNIEQKRFCDGFDF